MSWPGLLKSCARAVVWRWSCAVVPFRLSVMSTVSFNDIEAEKDRRLSEKISSRNAQKCFTLWLCVAQRSLNGRILLKNFSLVPIAETVE